MAKLPLTSDELLTTTRSVRKRLDLERGSAGAGRKLSQFRQYAKVAGVDPALRRSKSNSRHSAASRVLNGWMGSVTGGPSCCASAMIRLDRGT